MPMEETENSGRSVSEYDGAEDVVLDLDMVLKILSEDSDPSQKNIEEFPEHGSPELLASEEGSHYISVHQTVDPGTVGSGGSFDSGINPVQSIECRKFGQTYQTSASRHASLDISKDWLRLIHRDDAVDSERIGLSHSEMPGSCINLEPRCSDANSNHMPCFVDNLDISDRFKQVEGSNDHNHNYSSQSSFTGIDENFGISGAFDENAVVEASGRAENSSSTCLPVSVMNASGSSQMATSYDSSICQNSNGIDYADCHSSMHYSNDVDDRRCVPDSSLQFFPPSLNSQFLSYSDEANTTDEREEFFPDTACATDINAGVTGEKYFPSRAGFSSMDSSNAEVWKIYQDGQYLSLNSGDSSCNAVEGNYIGEEKISTHSVPFAHLYNTSMEQVLPDSEDQRHDELGMSYQNSTLGIHFDPYTDQKPTQFSGSSPYPQYEKSIDQYAMLSGNTNNWNLQPQEYQISVPNNQLSYLQSESDVEVIQNEIFGSHYSKLSYNQGKSSMVDDDEDDLCIIEDISHPAPVNRSRAPYISVNTQQYNAYGASHPYSTEVARHTTNTEQHILQVALQDLSQPKSEIYPPEGVLSVPLLRHQRIALSWMVQKETGGLCCSGGILADDQGLGKTVSTIALILKERSPPSKGTRVVEKNESQTFNLDEDDDIHLASSEKEVKRSDGCKQIATKAIKSSAQAKGRPSAGTLIVCPTSVLRQWAEELRNKVTKEANLSVLVYHGNRTKDPYELAKYDVVITTYSIVSMEVPKQPLVDNDEELVNSDEHAGPPMGFPSSKKRKIPPSSNKKSSKKLEAALLESFAGPLARVAWFRVVLDEAQSIKNHRTQVARACWGLRAKRRWCLSGTPIQNAIDDLFSYFRFLRYDPYAVYKSFCSTIKFPISRSPTRGYRKLQAVLQTIMLRRTKGTILDGEPIVSLPPKYVELRKIDFSDEERDFYSRLEADSRAQFKEYADAGTVKQNYVNILLMLLRLRQACDHPLLVNYNSNSLGKNSIELAKKLPWEKLECLLNRLQASLALCPICNDYPEDAVVSICGHVFCNQCICAHLTGDENQCPTVKCKAQLSKASVFSKSTLSNCLSNRASNSSPGSRSEVVDEVDPCSKILPLHSSKIKAALEFLRNLCKPLECTSSDVSTGSSCTETIDSPVDLSVNTRSPSSDCPQNRNAATNEMLNGAVTVSGGKAIVFSQWTRMLDLFEDCLKNSSIQYRRLDGTMSVVSRDKAVKEFNTLPEVSVMIMSLKAASLGLNMVAACNVLLLDLWWNPTTEDQAVDRAHRIGQTRPVTVLRLTVRDTVEDRILALQQKKRAMVASAFGEDEAEGRQTRLTLQDLHYLFNF